MIISAPYGWRNAAIRFKRNAPAQLRLTRGPRSELVLSKGLEGRFTFDTADLPPGNYELDAMPEPDDVELEGDGNPQDG